MANTMSKIPHQGNGWVLLASAGNPSVLLASPTSLELFPGLSVVSCDVEKAQEDFFDV